MRAGRPDRTWLFDVPLEVARARLADAREPDRFEREGAAFFERTREAYHARAKADPDRIRVVDSTRSIAQIRAAGATVELFEYPGDGHLFTDPSRVDEYDAEAAAQLWPRVLEFCRRHG